MTQQTISTTPQADLAAMIRSYERHIKEIQTDLRRGYTVDFTDMDEDSDGEGYSEYITALDTEASMALEMELKDKQEMLEATKLRAKQVSSEHVSSFLTSRLGWVRADQI